jgi:hypothetical protein
VRRLDSREDRDVSCDQRIVNDFHRLSRNGWNRAGLSARHLRVAHRCRFPSWPVLDEQALTRPVSSSANAASDMVIFFFIYCLLACLLFCRGHLSIPMFLRYEKSSGESPQLLRI